EKAGDAMAEENAHTALVAMETYATENGGSYTGVTMAKLNKIEPTLPSTEPEAGKEGIKVSTTASNKYKIESISSNNHTFSIVNEAGVLTYPCSPEEAGGCPSTKVWNK
ncbi:MAG TPA: hypothetical protein VHE08_01330, partial [Solirubrobacterales bacterium]|nr:hypothetical protein [Solirubrobacterales bacterium]